MSSIWQLPAVVTALLTWLAAQPTTIGDAASREAMRRQMTAKSARLYTNKDLPLTFATSSGSDATQAAASDPPSGQSAATGAEDESRRDEKWWRERIGSARANLERDEVLTDAMQTRVNQLSADIVSHDDPYQQAQLRQQLQKAVVELDRLQKLILADRKVIDSIQNDARRRGVPSGWIW